MQDSIYATISASPPLDLHVFVIPMCSARTKGSGGKEECESSIKNIV